MENWQELLAAITFLGVTALIMTEWTHLTIAALLGALLLVFAVSLISSVVPNIRMWVFDFYSNRCFG